MRQLSTFNSPPPASREQALRYLNFFRLLTAALSLFFGRRLGLGNESPEVFTLVSLIYLFCVLALGFPDAVRRFGFTAVTNAQFVIDITCLTLLLFASGGVSSGISVLVMVILAGAGLICSARMFLFYAAFATIGVLGENAFRILQGEPSADFSVLGMVCIGFFGIAGVAWALARRAQYNESLAYSRGEALTREEALNERIIRDMKDGVIVVDAQGRVLKSNPQAVHLMGGILPNGVLLSEIAPELDRLLKSPLPEESWDGAFGLLQHMVRCHAVKTKEAGQGAIFFLTDFDETQRAAQQVKLAALGRLTASIAHEIRNPLAAISQAAELSVEETRSEVLNRLNRIIQDNAARIEQLVRDVLSLGRRSERQPEKILLNEFLENFLADSEFGLGENRHLVEFDIPHDATILFDRLHLNQIFWNLISNAQRYCSGKPGAILIWANPLASEKILIHIVDDGPGISPENAEKVFEPFFTTHAKGTGLGMYISKELAEANQATLTLVPDTRGAHFCLSGKSAL